MIKLYDTGLKNKSLKVWKGEEGVVGGEILEVRKVRFKSELNAREIKSWSSSDGYAVKNREEIIKARERDTSWTAPRGAKLAWHLFFAGLSRALPLGV